MKLLEVYNKFDSSQAFINAINTELRNLMESNPDFVYNEIATSICFYNKGPKSNPNKCNGCIFGQVLQNLGWSDYQELEYQGDIINLFKKYVNKFSIPFYWRDIQYNQDSGLKWGELKKYLPK